MSIMEEIEILKTKISLELNSLKYHEEFSNIIGDLEKKILKMETAFCNQKNNNYLDEIFLLAYKSFLETFIEYDIKEINKIIAQGKDNAYDDRSLELLEKVQSFEEEIENVISYLNEQLPFMGKVVEKKYQEIKNKYYSKLDDSYRYNKTSFYQSLGIKKSICLSLYGSSSSLFKRYLCDLEIFKNEYINRLKVFIDNDIKIKDTIAKAKETFKEKNAIDAINQLETNYLENLKKCTDNFLNYKDGDVIKLQQEMLNRALHLEDLIKDRTMLEEYSNYLNSITFLDYDIDKLLEIEKYVNKNDTLEDDFYEIIYFIVEKDKRVKEKEGKDCRLYDKLSSETKIKLEKMFVDRLSLLEEDKIKEVLQEYKSKGFIGAKDSTLDDFFESVEIKFKPSIEFNVPSEEDILYKWDDQERLLEIRSKIMEKNPKYKMSPRKCELRQLGKDRYCMIIGAKEPHKYLYFDGDFNKLDVPDDMEMEFYFFNLYFGKPNNVLHIYDNNFNVIYESDTKCNEMHWVGNPWRKIPNIAIREIYDSEEQCKVFDKDGRLINKADLKDVIKKSGKKYKLNCSRFAAGTYDDSIIIAELKSDNISEVDYYRYNMNTGKIIDKSNYTWFNGRMLFRSDKNNLCGFKDYDGNVVIEPKYSDSSGFAGNIAFVKENGNKLIIDIFGNNISPEMLNIPPKSKVKNDYKNDRMLITKNGKEIGSFRVRNDFRIYIHDECKRNIPMLEYIRNNEQVKTLVKQ